MSRSTLFLRLGLTTAAAALVSCGTTIQQHMNLSAESLATPPHSMSHADYPFDESGRYVDAWAAEGAGRYGHRLDSDSQDHGREQRKKQPAAKKSSASSNTKKGGSTKKPAPKGKSKSSTKPKPKKKG